jgi:hypothetical protein
MSAYYEQRLAEAKRAARAQVQTIQAEGNAIS